MVSIRNSEIMMYKERWIKKTPM